MESEDVCGLGLKPSYQCYLLCEMVDLNFSSVTGTTIAGRSTAGQLTENILITFSFQLVTESEMVNTTGRAETCFQTM